MCRLMHRFWTAQEFAFFQLEGLFKSPVEISSKSMLGFSTSRHTSVHCVQLALPCLFFTKPVHCFQLLCVLILLQKIPHVFERWIRAIRLI